MDKSTPFPRICSNSFLARLQTAAIENPSTVSHPWKALGYRDCGWIGHRFDSTLGNGARSSLEVGVLSILLEKE